MKSMDKSRFLLVSMVKAVAAAAALCKWSGVIFLPHFWAPYKLIIPPWVLLLSPSIPFWPQSSDKAQIISNWFLEEDNEFTALQWPPPSPDLNPIEHLWDVVEQHIMDVQPTNLQQQCDDDHVNVDQNLWSMFSNTLLKVCHKELRQFWRQRGVGFVGV